MRSDLFSIRALIILPCLIFLWACNNAGSYDSSTGQKIPDPPPPSPPPPPTVLTDCGVTISFPGTYSLNSALTTSDGNGEACITIANVNNVTLNCNGNSITGTGQNGISVLNVSRFVLENCNVVTGVGDGGSTLLALNNVNDGTITGSTFGSNQKYLGGVTITDSTNVTFGSPVPSAPANPSVTATTNPALRSQIANAPPPSNIVHGYVEGANNINFVVEGNAITGFGSVLMATMIGVSNDQGTRIVENTVNGMGSPLSKGLLNPGSDDDIFITDETGPGSLVSGNIIVNTWDCGIETSGFMKDIELSANYIDSVPTGMGGWYWLSVSNARFTQNVMTNILYRGFHYFRIGPLRSAGGETSVGSMPPGMPAETTINFTQNQFIGNILYPPLVMQGVQTRAVDVPVYSGMDYTSGTFPGTDPTPEQFITVENTFTNNAFDTGFGPLEFTFPGDRWSYTSDDVIDGGGNICSGSQNLVPLVSPTFTTLPVPTTPSIPINCGN